MKSPPFKYMAASSVHDVLSVLLEHGDDALVLAGGQSLVPLLNLRLVNPRVLVDVNGVDELAGISVDDGVLRIGALVRQRTLASDDTIRAHAPLLADAATLIGHVAVRNRGTLGGSLAFGDPDAELPAAILALDAEVVVRSRDSDRTIAATELYEGPFQTTLRSDELLVEVRVPLPEGHRGVAFREVSRRVQDPALSGAAVVLSVDGGSTCERARVALCGAGPTPIRVTAAEEALTGAALADITPDGVAAAVTDAADPIAGIHGSAAYRRRLAGVVARRALDAAIGQLTERSEP